MVLLMEDCYWRYKGEKEYHYGYPTLVGSGLVRMGVWHGDGTMGPMVEI